MDAIKKVTVNEKTLKIFYDDSFESPRNWDNLGKMICFHNRYNLGDEHNYNSDDYSGWDEMEQDIIKNEDVAVILPLYLYDHSGITISTNPFGCRWDSWQVGFAIVTKEAVRKEFMSKRVSKKQIEKAEKILLTEVDIYDTYIRGDVYGFEVLDKNEDVINSCWGFYGTDFEKNGIAEYVEEKELITALLEKV